MLEIDPAQRITAQQCLEHPWFSTNGIDQNNISLNLNLIDDSKFQVLRRIENFCAPKLLQIEALTFLVNSVDNSTFNFKKLRNVFRTLDTDNSGNLDFNKIRAAFEELLMPEDEIN